MPKPTFDDIVADIKRVAKRLGKKPGDSFTRSEYLDLRNEPTYSHDQLYTHGGGWKKCCPAAGFRTRETARVSDEEMFQRFEKACEELGHVSNTYERKRYGLENVKRRFPQGFETFLRRAAEEGYATEYVAEYFRNRPSNADQGDSRELESRPVEKSAIEKSVRPRAKRTVPSIPAQSKREKWKRIGVRGFPFAPHDELGLVALFGILCSNGTIGWDILEMNGGKGIDATCFDHKTKRDIRVELKRDLKRYGFNHNLDEIDYVVCWENRWKNCPKPVIELCKLLRERD